MLLIIFIPSNYLESWLVDIIDEIASIYERSYSIKNELATTMGVLAIMITNYIR